MSAEINLHRAVGQLITGRLSGTEMTDGVERIIAEGTISGITLFKDNGRDLKQLAQLTYDIRRDAREDFLLSVDEEGGAVQRFDHIITPLPSAMSFAALGDHDRMSQLMSMHAQHLITLGINCNLIPVLDVNSNPKNPIIGTRSYGDDLDKIVSIAKAAGKTYLQNGVLPVGKHFPGHGDTAADSHLELAVVHADRQTLESRELAPFVACLGDLPGILIAHVWVPALDEERLPASLSQNVVTGLLRNQLNYDGFLMTDDMPGMKALTGHWGLEEAAILSINAGLDHLLMCGTAEQVTSVHSALMKAVQKGTITEKTLADALRRRATFVKRGAPTPPSAESTLSVEQRVAKISGNINDARKLAVQLSSESIYVNRGRLPNINSLHGEWVFIVPDHPRYRMNILDALSKYPFPAETTFHERRYNVNPTPDEIADVVTFADGRRCIFLTFRALLNEAQLSLAKQLAACLPEPGLLVATDVPYEIAALPQWHNAIALFDPNDQGIRGLVHALTHHAVPKGTSPVKLT